MARQRGQTPYDPGGMAGSPHRVLMGLQFFPRGGSAHVALKAARNLTAAG